MVAMPIRIYHFDTPASTHDWHPIDDAVMGGVSFSRLCFDSTGHAVFEGKVSLQNQGGFASVRTSSLQLGCPETMGYLLCTWGDGKTYKLNLRNDSGFDGVNYQAAFTPAADAWNQTFLPLTDFLPNFRGRLVHGAPSLRPEDVAQVGLMISDQQAGPFRLQVKFIEAVTALPFCLDR